MGFGLVDCLVVVLAGKWESFLVEKLAQVLSELLVIVTVD